MYNSRPASCVLRPASSIPAWNSLDFQAMDGLHGDHLGLYRRPSHSMHARLVPHQFIHRVRRALPLSKTQDAGRRTQDDISPTPKLSHYRQGRLRDDAMEMSW